MPLAKVAGCLSSAGKARHCALNGAQSSTATTWAPGGPTIRFHIGLEDVDDLIEDLDQAFGESLESRESDESARIAARTA